MLSSEETECAYFKQRLRLSINKSNTA